MSETPTLPTPYIGLIPYDEKSADFFFGREAEEQIITSNLKASRLTLLYGASGVGKSSVLRAGVAYHLKKLAQQNMARRGKPKFVVVFFNSWRDDPLAGLITRIRETVAEVLNQPDLEVPDPSLPFPEILRQWSRLVQGSLLIILDQFEEYFLYHPNEEGERTFATEFPNVINDSSIPANFLVSFREDAYAKLDFFKGRVNGLYENFLRVGHLDREAARGAITKPIDHYNQLLESRSGASNGNRITIEPQLVATVLKQVESGRVILGESGRGVVEAATDRSEATIETPFLQLVMTRLWKEEMRENSKVLRLETLTRLKGAENIVRSHVDETMDAFPAEKQAIAAAVFHYLVTPGGTKIAHTIPDLADYSKLPKERLGSTLEELAGGETRILRVIEPPPDRPGEQRYEIFHDVLGAAILDWRARYALQEERAETERRLAEEARERALAVRQLARERSLAGRLRWALIGLALLLLLMAGVTVWATRQQKEAVNQRGVAENQRRVAEEAKTEADRLRWLAEEATAGANRARDIANQALVEKERQRIAADQAFAAAKESASRAEEQTQIANAAKSEASEAAEVEKKTRLGLTEIRAGKVEDARPLLEDAIKGYEARGDASGQIFALASLAEAYANLARVFSSTFMESVILSGDPDEQEHLEPITGMDYSSFIAGIFKGDAKTDDDKKEAEELSRNRQKAAQYYEAALRVIESNQKLAPTNKALVLHRLGDIYAHVMSAFSPSGDSVEKARSLQIGTDYYDRASEAYRIDGKPIDQASMLRHAAEFLSFGLDAERASKDEAGFRKDLSASAEYFKRAAAVYKQVNKPLKAAVMFSQVGENYEKAPESELRKRDLAIQNYQAAATIFGANNRTALEAPLNTKIGQLYAELNQKDNAASYYGQAYKAFRQAESLEKEKNISDPSSKTEDLRTEALKSIVYLYMDKDEKKNEEEKRKADVFFKGFITKFEDPNQKAISHDLFEDPIERATALDIIGKAYYNNPYNPPKEQQDKRRAVYYLELERDAWHQANRLFEETKASLDVLAIHVQQDDREEINKSFDPAIKLYRKVKPQLMSQEKRPLLSQLTSQFSNNARYLSEHNEKDKAAELYEELLELNLTSGAYVSQTREAYSVLARLYIGQKYFQQAEEVFKKVLAFYANNPDVKASTLAYIGSLYAESPEGRNDAQNYYLQAALAELALYPSLTQPYEKDDTLREAREALQKTAELSALLENKRADAFLITFADAARNAQVPESLKEAIACEVLGDFYSNFKVGPNEEALPPGFKSKALAPYERARLLYHDLKEKPSEARVLRRMSAIYESMGGPVSKAKSKELADQADQLLKPN